MQQDSLPRAAEGGSPEGKRLSYKFQRLREQLRQAIRRGDFSGQLPGERELGRQFEANAKTINKALCDLASEGLLVRIIGRGTFVADGNGSSTGVTSELVYRMMCPAGAESQPHRQAMVSALRDSLARKGHRLECHEVERSNADGSIPLASWHTAQRRGTAGMISYPVDALSSGRGEFDEEFISETWRRHVPTAVLSACADGLKLNSVMPDYVVAGFSTAEHLFLLGCRRVIVLTANERGRETGMVMTGCRTAALRHDRLVSRIDVGAKEWPERLLAELSGSNGQSADHHAASVGIICVGAAALASARADTTVARLVTCGELAVACVLEPGDPTPRQTNLTAYEFDVAKVADWTARILLDARPGQRPIEVLVPGELCIRETIRPHSGGNGRHGAKSDQKDGTRMYAVEAVI